MIKMNLRVYITVVFILINIEAVPKVMGSIPVYVCFIGIMRL
jgi:hypothetical protein